MFAALGVLLGLLAFHPLAPGHLPFLPDLPAAPGLGGATAGTQGGPHLEPHLMQATAPVLAAHQCAALTAGLSFLYKPPANACQEDVVKDLAAKMDRNAQLGSAVKKVFDKLDLSDKVLPKSRVDRARAVTALLLGSGAAAAGGA